MLQDTIKDLQKDFDDVIKFDEVGFALGKLDIIDELLKNNPEVAVSPEKRKILETMQIQLELVCLPNLDDERCLDVLRKDFLLALIMPGYDLEDKLSQKIIFKEFDELEIDFAEKILKAITENNAKIGNGNLTIGDRVLPPSLKNWFLDYQNFPVKSGYRTNLEEVEYMNKSTNTKLLDKKNWDILLECLKLRDLLFNLVHKYYSLPETTDENLAFKGFNLFKWLPGLDDEGMQTFQVKTPFKMRDELFGIGVAASTLGSDSVSGEKFELPREVLGEEGNVRPLTVPRPGDGKDVGMSEVGGRRSDGLDVISSEKITSPNPSLERRGMGTAGNITPLPPLILRGGDNEKTASGEAIGSLTAKNDFRGQAGAVGSAPVTSTTLQEKLYQGNNNEANNPTINQKPQLSRGDLADSDTMREKSGLPSKNRLAQPQNVVNSGGPQGTRTPRVTDGKPDSAPYAAHSDELYHSSAQITPNRVNFQDVLKDREQAIGNRQSDFAKATSDWQGDAAGLRMGGGIKQISNNQFPIPKGNTGNNSSSFILNPLLEKKPVAPQSGQSRQAEIDRKLEELQKRIKN